MNAQRDYVQLFKSTAGESEISNVLIDCIQELQFWSYVKVTTFMYKNVC